MSSDEAEKKNVDEPSTDALSSTEENDEKNEEKPTDEKVNNKASKKKAADPPKIKQPAKKRVKSEQAEKEAKKEEKKEAKKKKEEVVEEEESEEENDINHKVVPLLDQPLEISGKRQTKVVQRFKPVEPEEDNKEVKIPEGKGKVLGEIERIEFNIQRAKPEDLKILHRICFAKPGKAATVKKVLKKFKGFEFSVDSDEFKKKKEFVDKSFKKVTVAHLKNLCNILDIERGGTKEDLIDRVLKFITCPVDSGKKLPGGGRSKRKGVSNKNYEEDETSHISKRKTKAKKKDAESDEESEKEDEEEVTSHISKRKTKAKKKDAESDEESEKEEEEEETSHKSKRKTKAKKKDVESEEESEKEDEDEKEDVEENDIKEKENEESDDEKSKEEEEEEEEKEVEKKKKPPPKKGAKKGKKAAADIADKKAPPKKRAAAKKAVEKSESEADGEESEDEEPLSKKTKTPPTDEEIKTYVKSLLEGANLELITMKKVCQDVYAHYPDFDLAHKKDFIKTTVKNLISS